MNTQMYDKTKLKDFSYFIPKDEGRRCVVNLTSERHYVLTVASLMFQIFWNGHVNFHI